eukprot:INCI16058.4.p1 GENE.INCI16058.4~~INCI16058.4.p1  ORF type:complete len:970 (+),score=146.18 INCI16058.4:162-2912(+)
MRNGEEIITFDERNHVFALSRSEVQELSLKLQLLWRLIGARHNQEWTHAYEIAKLFRNWPIVATKNGIVVTVFFAVERMIVFESDFNGDINGDSAVEAEDGHDQDNGSDPCSGGHNRTGSEVHSMMHIGCLFCSDEIQALRLVLHNRRSHGLKAVLNALLAGAGPKVVCTQQQILSVANANIERCSVQREQVVFRVELNEDPQEAYAHARQLVLSWSKHGCPGHDAQVPASNSVILSSHILARVPVFQTLQPGTLACISSSQFAVKAGINSIEKLGRKDSAAFRFSQEPLIRTFANHSMNTPASTAPADVDTVEEGNQLSQWERLLLPHIPHQLLDLRSSDSVHIFRVAEGHHSPEIPFLLEIVVPFLLRKRAHFKRRSIQEIILYLLSAVGARLARRHLESMTQLKTSRHPDSAALMDVLDRLRKCEFIPDMQVEPMEATDLASISESSSTMRRCSDFVDPQDAAYRMVCDAFAERALPMDQLIRDKGLDLRSLPEPFVSHPPALLSMRVMGMRSLHQPSFFLAMAELTATLQDRRCGDMLAAFFVQKWDMLIDPDRQGVGWPTRYLSLLADVAFIPCQQFQVKNDTRDPCHAGGSAARDDGIQPERPASTRCLGFIADEHFSSMYSHYQNLQKAMNSLATVKKPSKARKSGRSKRGSQIHGGRALDVLASLAESTSLDYAANNSTSPGDDPLHRFWSRQQGAMGLLKTARSNFVSVGGQSVGRGFTTRTVFSSLSAFKSTYSTLAFPWSFWETWTSALQLPAAFMKVSARMLKFFAIDPLPRATPILQHIVNIAKDVANQPVLWRRDHGDFLKGLLVKSISVLQFQYEKYKALAVQRHGPSAAEFGSTKTRTLQTFRAVLTSKLGNVPFILFEDGGMGAASSICVDLDQDVNPSTRVCECLLNVRQGYVQFWRR